MWNQEPGSEFIQEELFTSNLGGVSDSPKASPTSNFLSTSRPVTIKGREKELRSSLPEFRVVRSSRRKRSIQAFRHNGMIEIHIPDRMSRREELEVIPEMIELVLKREAKSRKSDDQLIAWAEEVLAQFLPDFHERPASIAWRAMRERWGSCTTVDRTIRISDRLNGAPLYVVKHVLLHELIHLRISGHGKEFEAFLERNPEGAKAESYLEGFEAGSSGNSDIYL